MNGFTTFASIATGFALIGLGVSPLVSRRNVDVPELGCVTIIIGIAIIVITTAIKVLS
jgi:hypothetical protein